MNNNKIRIIDNSKIYIISPEIIETNEKTNNVTYNFLSVILNIFEKLNNPCNYQLQKPKDLYNTHLGKKDQGKFVIQLCM
jgi:hypothetical protein